jgi:hypothetical protein
MHYILPGLEIAMGMPAFKSEISEAIAVIGPPPSFIVPESGSADPEAVFERALNSYRRQIMAWRSDTLALLPRLDSLLIQAQEAAGVDGVRELMADLMPVLWRALDDALAHAERTADIDPAIRAKLTFAARVSPEAAKTIKAIIKKYRNASESYRQSLIDLHDRLKIVEWDHDPDARGGPSFDNADDLIASLRA